MKRKIGMVLLGLSVLMSANASARELSVKEKQVIEAVAKEQLKDPDSAKFTWQDYRGGETYCAYVNAKNSYGGYSGDELLIVGVKLNAKGQVISAETTLHEGQMRALMAPICTKEGYKG